MVNTCCVKSCPNHKWHYLVRQTPRPKMHSFPVDSQRMKVWASKCQVDEDACVSLRVCSRHFLPGDYDVKLKRTVLCNTSVPSVELPGKTSLIHRVLLPANLRGPRPDCVYEAKIGDNLKVLLSFNAQLFVEAPPSSIPILGVTMQNRERDDLREELSLMHATVAKLEAQLRIKNSVISSLQDQVKRAKKSRIRQRELKNHWQKQNNKRMKILADIRKKALQTETVKQESMFGRFSKEALKIFSPAQIRHLVSKSKRVRWSSDDIAQAIAIRARSNQCYNFFRKVIGFPLPDQSTLCRWSAALPFRCGLQEEILKLLKHQLMPAQPISSIAGMCFDEMNTDSRLQYDRETDSILGLTSGMTVVVLRALCDSWKQPVFYTFDKITPEIIKHIIYAVECAGIQVRSITCDMSGPNRSIANALDISEETPFFTNPHNSRKVYWFYDAPHLHKLLRNHILDQGIRISCNRTLAKSHFERLLAADRSDFKICFKLSSLHVDVRDRQRQRVIYATQLLSRTTSLAFQTILNEPELASFIRLVNDWFDVFNSRYKQDEVRKPFGMDMGNQLTTLAAMEQEMKTARIVGKREMLPFQRGIIISINSLRGLFEELCTAPPHINRFYTKGVNQDVCENCFGMVRSLGRYHDCPNAAEAKGRLKTIMFGWNFREKTTAVATEFEDSQPTTFLSSMLLSSVNARKRMRGTANDGVEDDVDFPEQEDSSHREYLPTEDNWDEFYSTLDAIGKCEFGGKEYVSGFLARKLQRKYPLYSLGPTSMIFREPKSWTQLKSRGGLAVPSYDWLRSCEEMDKVFVNYHNVGAFKINQSPGAMRGLAAKIKKMFPAIPFLAIQKFVKVRTHIRIKHVNQTIVDGRSKNKKKRTQFAQGHVPYELRSRGVNDGGDAAAA